MTVVVIVVRVELLHRMRPHPRARCKYGGHAFVGTALAVARHCSRITRVFCTERASSGAVHMRGDHLLPTLGVLPFLPLSRPVGALAFVFLRLCVF